MARKKKGGGEYEYHIVGIRSRVTGSGNMQFRLEGLDTIRTQNLVPLPLSTINAIEPTRLCNFQSQRTRLVGSVGELGNWFQIRRIVIFAKPVAVEYPG